MVVQQLVSLASAGVTPGTCQAGDHTLRACSCLLTLPAVAAAASAFELLLCRLLLAEAEATANKKPRGRPRKAKMQVDPSTAAMLMLSILVMPLVHEPLSCPITVNTDGTVSLEIKVTPVDPDHKAVKVSFAFKEPGTTSTANATPPEK